MASTREDAELRLLLVDGDNVLHDLRGRRDESSAAWLLPRLTRWRPPGLRIVIALDGHPAPGEPGRRRAAPGVEFHHAGARSADDVIIDLLSGQPFADRARTAVVTRDRDLLVRVRQVGGLTRSVDWLWRGLEHPQRATAATSHLGPLSEPRPEGSKPHPAGSSIGQGRPPRAGAPGATGDSAADHRPWAPGRGVTHKRGNPRRGTRPPAPR